MSADTQRAAHTIDQWLAEHGSPSAPPAVCDVLIIGSGYGGSFAARELAAPGETVWVMERGREFALGEFPEDIGMLPAQVRMRNTGAADAVGNSDALLEFRRFDQLTVLLANGLGGGSLINAGVAIRPEAELLSNPSWPGHYRRDPAGRTALWAAMAEVEAQLQVAPLSGATGLAKYQALNTLGESKGVSAFPAPLTIASHDQVSPAGVAQKACTRCGNCFTGCNVGAKNTTVTHVLPDAARKGAQFYTGATALEVLPARTGASAAGQAPLLPTGLSTPAGRPARWTVRMVCTQGQKSEATRREFEVHAHTVILAAGALGSTEVLLGSPHIKASHRLGTRFSTNGDVLALGWGMQARTNGMATPGQDTSVLQAAADQVGPTITGIVRTHIDLPDGGTREVLIEEGAIPSALTQTVIALGATASLPHRYVGADGPAYFGPGMQVDRLTTPPDIGRHALLLLGMGYDDADGVVSLDELPDEEDGTQGRHQGAAHEKQHHHKATSLNIRWPSKYTGPAAPYYQGMHNWLKDAAAKPDGGGFQGGDYLPNPLWKALPDGFNAIAGDAPAPQGMTVHPLGGCGMGDDAHSGVVDWRGTVFHRDGGVLHGLHVLDGAMLPSAVGVNPFLTISALCVVAARSIRQELDLSAPTVAPRLQGANTPQVEAPATPGAPTKQWQLPQKRRQNVGPITLRFREHLQGHWKAIAPEWLPKPDASLTPSEAERAWIVAVDVSLDLEQWLANPSMQLPGAKLALYRNPTPHAMTVQANACAGTPVLQGTGWLSLLALDAPATRWEQAMRVLAAIGTYIDRRSIQELLNLAFPKESLKAAQKPTQTWKEKLDHAWTSTLGYLRAGRNIAQYRELIYSFELHKPDHPQFKVDALGRKRLAYAPKQKNVWDALVDIDLELTPRNGQNPATLSVTADLIDMVRNRRLQVEKAPDTPTGIAGMGAFVSLWCRSIFQSHFWSFRGLDYDQLAPPAPAEHGPLHGAQALQRVVLPVPRYRDNTKRNGAAAHEKLNLELTCYPPIEGRSNGEHLLMVHGLAHGGTVFTTDTTDGNNMAAAFVQAGYTVWVLDHRLSNRLPYQKLDHCMDDVAALDMPAAVRHVYAAAGAPIAVFAHCVGGGAFAMATLKGWLMDTSHTPEPVSMVGKAIIHAVHPWIVPSASNQLSGALATLYKDLMPPDLSVDPVPTAESSGGINQVIDRLAASLPWPPGELGLHLKHQFDPQGGTATCNRMTLFYGREWVHDNLNEATHQQLASLVGPASIEVFQQLYFLINRQHLTDRDGAQVYMTAEQFKAHWTFPILFAHGSENRVFDPRSAVRSWNRLRHVQPERTVRVFMAEGYGHMDFLFGQNAHRDVYPALCEFLRAPAAFTSSWNAEVDASHIPSHWQDHCAWNPRAPLVGPHIRLDEVQVNGQPQRQLVLWAELPHDASLAPAPLQATDAAGDALPGWSATRLQASDYAFHAGRDVALLHGQGAHWVGHLTESSALPFAELDDVHLQRGSNGHQGQAVLALQGLPWFKRWTGQSVHAPVSWLAVSCRWPGTPFEGVAVDTLAQHMLSHVHHSSLPVDALVMLGDQIYADAAANLFKIRETDELRAQAYRDAWGGPHAQALLSALPSYTVVDDHEYGDNWSGAADNCDDTKLLDGFEAALAYQWRWGNDPASRYAGLRSKPAVTHQAVTGFWGPFAIGGVPAFAADTRSERSLRTQEHWRQQGMVGTAQMQALTSWLLDHKDEPKVLCSGSVFGFVENALDNTGNADLNNDNACLHTDDWWAYPHTWRTLVQFIVENQIQHIVFMSGDYHFSGMAELELYAAGGQPMVRAVSVVSSGWNASLPFANAAPSDFVMQRWVNAPLGDAQANVRSCAAPLSTALRQFSKVSLIQNAQHQWQVQSQVYGEHGEKLAQGCLSL